MNVHTRLICTYQWHPPLPHPQVGWGNNGDLTEYYVKNPSPGALPDVSSPIYCQESIRDCINLVLYSYLTRVHMQGFI